VVFQKMPNCSKCPTRVKHPDTHKECPLHSTCYNGSNFDPRKCTECINLFNLAKMGEAEACKEWKSRVSTLKSTVGEGFLHPQASDWVLPLTDLSQEEASIATGIKFNIISCPILWMTCSGIIGFVSQVKHQPPNQLINKICGQRCFLN